MGDFDGRQRGAGWPHPFGSVLERPLQCLLPDTKLSNASKRSGVMSETSSKLSNDTKSVNALAVWITVVGALLVGGVIYALLFLK